MSQIVPIRQAVLADLIQTMEEAADYARNSRAENTVAAYGYDWRHFSAWCADHALDPLPALPQTIAAYITEQAKSYKLSTIQRRLSTISVAHEEAGHLSPTKHRQVKAVLEGIRRALGTAQEAKAPATTDVLLQMLATLGTERKDLRDRALLLVGFGGAFRRAELVALDVRDVTFSPQGLVVVIRRSKTDQEGRGEKLGIPFGSRPETCPARTLRAWLDEAGIAEGAIFRSVDRHGNVGVRLDPKDVARTVKRCAKAAGFDPALYAGHSLRAGLATAAAQAGAMEHDIKRQTRHKSNEMVQRYIRDGTLFDRNVAGRVGL